jgi:hypothetical protein
MSGVRPPETIPPSVRRQWRAEREAVQEAARRRDRLAAMSPHERQIAALEELRYLEQVAADKAAAATDPARKAELETIAADLRRTMRKEREMPVDMTTPATIRAQFNEKAGRIRSDLDALSADDGREATWKNRERTRLVSDLQDARQEADKALGKWATAAAREAAKGLNADTRSPEDCMKDLAVELRTQRLAASCTTQTEAENKLMSEARRLRSVDFRQSLSYAQAAATHGASGAASLAAEIEAEHRQGWSGHAEAAELAQTVERQVSAWQTEAAAVTVQVGRAAIAAARRTGDSESEAKLAQASIMPSIQAKLSAYAASQRDGVPYQDPIGPNPSPTIETAPIHASEPSTTIR